MASAQAEAQQASSPVPCGRTSRRNPADVGELILKSLQCISRGLSTIDSSIFVVLEEEKLRVAESIAAAIPEVEGSMALCLADHALQPHVNTEGVATMLREAHRQWCCAEADLVVEKLRRDLSELLEAGCAELQRVPIDKSTLSEALIMYAVKVLSGEPETTQAALTCREFLKNAAEWKDSVAVFEQIVQCLDGLSIRLQVFTEAASAIVARHFVPAHRKEQELRGLAIWFNQIVMASHELMVERQRRTAAKAALAQRCSQLQRELDLLADSEDLERQQFVARFGRYLPRSRPFDDVDEVAPRATIAIRDSVSRDQP